MSGKKHDYSTCYAKFLNKWRKIVEQSPEAAGHLFDIGNKMVGGVVGRSLGMWGPCHVGLLF